jgi:(p)ppGpp synthase/HD superfamily hydrolase
MSMDVSGSGEDKRMARQSELAQAIAYVAHSGQSDKAGRPYIEHPARVAASLSASGFSDDIVAAGWLHDVLEDTSLTRDDLFRAGINGSVLAWVEDVTRKQDVPAEQYYERIASVHGARMVKLADIADNLDPERLSLLDDAAIVRLVRKYAKARLMLGARNG